jgi:hypothetical protein
MNDRTAELEAAVRAQDALIAAAQELLTRYLANLAERKDQRRSAPRAMHKRRSGRSARRMQTSISGNCGSYAEWLAR